MKMFKEITISDSFICLDDISGRPESMNHVIYNPAIDDIITRRDKLFRHISERFNFELTEDELLRLISYDRYHLAEFAEDLREIVRKKK